MPRTKPGILTTDYEKGKEAFARLLKVMDELREQCPWDRKQTMETLRPLTIEEMYELADAILAGDLQEVKKELGDVLLHLVFYARIGDEKGVFDVADVCNALVEKLIHRHPHIYGNVEADTEEQVKANWEQIKRKEKKGETKSVLAGVPKSLPALVKATRLQEKAQGVGFDWPERKGAYEKVREELTELEAEAEAGADPQRMEEEFGDIMFAMINYARFLKINPDNALERTNLKFIRRFRYMEDRLQHQERLMEDMSLEELDKLWDEAKQEEKK